MTGGGAYDGDMPTFPRTTQGEIPPVGDPAYDALLARTLAPDDAPTGLRPVAEGFAALYEAPVNVAWSMRNRSPMLRIPERRGLCTRVEHRVPDPAANPYLALAVMLAGVWLAA